MTKYILVGGYPHKTKDEGRGFFKSLLEKHTEPVKFLECLFARPKDQWQEAFLSDENQLEVLNLGIEVDIKCATEESFIEEVKWADVIYFRGGDIDLVEALSKYKGWEKFLEGKTVAGSSMGAYMLSKYYYDITTFDIKSGLGLVDAKVIVHFYSHEYQVDWEKASRELKEYEKDLPSYNLKEGEFAVIEGESR